jgi:tetratricopeptide (TPR) repeat protein
MSQLLTPAGWARLLPVGAALAGLAAAAAFSIRAGWADYCMRQETVDSTRRAIALMPDQAEYYARLAWLVADLNPPTASDALRRAVALNPWDARSWIELGLGAEAEGDAATSIQCLLRAAEVDKKFLPRWTLANYYFRHDDVAMFWFWTRQAAAMVYGDALPMFRLCGKVQEDGNLIDRLEIRDPGVRAAYLSYLLDQNRVDLIAPAVHRLLERNREADVPLLLTACERLLNARRVDQAAETWNRLADAGRVPFKTPAGVGGQLLANGTFALPPTSLGFDWRLPVVEGISVSREESPLGLRVTFSGRQPEDCESLVQLVPLRGKTPYQLSFAFRTSGIPSGAGLAWRIADAITGTVLAEGPSLASEAETLAHLSFAAPVECRLVRLSLSYRRAPGTTRMEGFLVLRNVALEPLPQPPVDVPRVR